ncbi:uncharacterized protein LOC127877628 [Dreissena polymorpha]|uniref:uncharacterized protein LOC127877628 n=1 Tax=Dreissena polymorpha TaxID=45954 RepID=UPI0022645EE1|nr:uncharacterized protein LOC127877628 [Dreissena polymorpha]
MNITKIWIAIFVSAALLWQTTHSQNSTFCVTGSAHCSWEEWGTWSACSKTCGTGTRSRQRGLCCTLKQTFNECVTSCHLRDDDSIETETCSFVCPAGNCIYEKIADTGIEVTDYKTLIGADGKITNAPLHLKTPTERFCKTSCECVNFNNGYFCWAYTWNNVTRCYLHFYKNPLIVAQPELKGQHTGQSLNIRSCTENERLESSTCVYNITTHNDTGLLRCKDGERSNKCDTDTLTSRIHSSNSSPLVLTAFLVPLMVVLVTVTIISGVLIRRKFLNSKQVVPVGPKINQP